MTEPKISNDCVLRTYFKNSIWIVPSSTLLAYRTIDAEHTAVQDQTIWIINKYKKGYIFGTS